MVAVKDIPSFYAWLLRRGYCERAAIGYCSAILRVLTGRKSNAVYKDMGFSEREALRLWNQFEGGDAPELFPLAVAWYQLRLEGHEVSRKHIKTVAKWYGAKKMRHGGWVYYMVGRDFFDFFRRYEAQRQVVRPVEVRA